MFIYRVLCTEEAYNQTLTKVAKYYDRNVRSFLYPVILQMLA